jgi:hypothetical protein
MRQQVEQGEKDRSGLLGACKSPKRPFSVVLLNRLAGLDVLVSYFVHAPVFAVLVAGPAGQLQRQGH